jgi:hypothetical protein
MQAGQRKVYDLAPSQAYGDRQVVDITGNVSHTNLSDDDLSRRLLELRTAHEIASKA